MQFYHMHTLQDTYSRITRSMSGQDLGKRNAATAWDVCRNLGRHRVERRVLAPVVRNLRLTLIPLENRVARFRMLRARC